jgi:hypothetical protein
LGKANGSGFSTCQRNRHAPVVVANKTCRGASNGRFDAGTGTRKGNAMNSIIYIVGLIVVVLFILSFLGLT